MKLYFLLIISISDYSDFKETYLIDKTYNLININSKTAIIHK